MASRTESRAQLLGGPPLLLIIVLLALAGLILVARGRVFRSERFHVDPGIVTVERRPDWMSAALAADLARHIAGGLGPPASLVSEADLDRWRHALRARSAWIEGVEAVEPRFPGQADVRLRLGRPVLVLPGDLLVSGDGERLGHGVVSSEPPPLHFEGPGDMEDLRECAAAAQELLPHRFDLLAEGVAVARVRTATAGRVVFVTPEGVELEWGRSARKSEFSAVDLPPKARIANLLGVLERRPGLVGVERVVLWKDRPDVFLAP